MVSFCFTGGRKKASCLYGLAFFVGLLWIVWVVYMSVMPFSWHCCLIVSGHILACVSPTWALCRSIMHSLLCPMPPPMDCGSCPLRSRWWKYSCFRFSLPASFNW